MRVWSRHDWNQPQPLGGCVHPFFSRWIVCSCFVTMWTFAWMFVFEWNKSYARAVKTGCVPLANFDRTHFCRHFSPVNAKKENNLLVGKTDTCQGCTSDSCQNWRIRKGSFLTSKFVQLVAIVPFPEPDVTYCGGKQKLFWSISRCRFRSRWLAFVLLSGTFAFPACFPRIWRFVEGQQRGCLSIPGVRTHVWQRLDTMFDLMTYAILRWIITFVAIPKQHFKF